MIESQDRHIGRVMDWLRETGELDNTLIIYMTDNGPEGTDAFGELGNPALSGWMERPRPCMARMTGLPSSYLAMLM